MSERKRERKRDEKERDEEKDEKKIIKEGVQSANSWGGGAQGGRGCEVESKSAQKRGSQCLFSKWAILRPISPHYSMHYL